MAWLRIINNFYTWIRKIMHFYHLIPEERQNLFVWAGIEPRSCSSQATALTTRPWLLGLEVGLLTGKEKAGFELRLIGPHIRDNWLDDVDHSITQPRALWHHERVDLKSSLISAINIPNWSKKGPLGEFFQSRGAFKDFASVCHRRHFKMSRHRLWPWYF